VHDRLRQRLAFGPYRVLSALQRLPASSDFEDR
jgi:hypothetical protein